MKKLRQWWRNFRNFAAADRVIVLSAQLVDAEKKREEDGKNHQEECRKYQEQIRLIQLEVADLTKRLETERASYSKARNHVERLWGFIALRHRIDTPAANGTIRKILQEAERRR